MRFRFLRPRSVFFIGFGIGFIFPLLLCLLKSVFRSDLIYDQKSWQSEYYLDKKVYKEGIALQPWKKEKTSDYFNNVTYNVWLTARNLRLYKINLDKYLYGPQEENDIEKIANMEWNWLKEQVSIICVVFAEKLKLAKSIQATWGKRCNRIYFFGHRLKDTELPIININIKIVSSWQLLCEAMNHIWNDRSVDKLEWIIFVKDDTMVIPENLRYMVAPLDHTDDYYLGHPVIMWGQSYNIAQSGFVLSKGALAKIIRIFNTSEKCITGGRYWKKEDYYLGKHLSSLGIHPSDTRDQYLRGTFHGYSLQHLLWGVIKPDSYWTRAIYPIKGLCCSPMSITFSVSEPDKMHMLNYLLYHLRVFISKGKYGTIPVESSISEENVWKLALQEEFNITHLSNISSDAYYEIWHSKYSEPGQLKIAKDYQMTLGMLKCLLMSYKTGNGSAKDCVTENVTDSTKT